MPVNRKRASQARHARTYLIVWDEHSADLTVTSRYVVTHSLHDVATAYSEAFDRQCQAMPGKSVSFLPMPRVFAIDGYIRELPESGYDLITPMVQDGGNDGQAA